MKIRCYDPDQIKNLIESSGLKKTDIAEDLGLKPYALSFRIYGRCSWKYEEIVRLSELLGFNLEDIIKVSRKQSSQEMNLDGIE